MSQSHRRDTCCTCLKRGFGRVKQLTRPIQCSSKAPTFCNIKMHDTVVSVARAYRNAIMKYTELQSLVTAVMFIIQCIPCLAYSDYSILLQRVDHYINCMRYVVLLHMDVIPSLCIPPPVALMKACNVLHPTASHP